MLLVPFASATLFCRAAAGLKNMCENLDQGIDPNSTVVAMRYRARKRYAEVVCPSSAPRPEQAKRHAQHQRDDKQVGAYKTEW